MTNPSLVTVTNPHTGKMYRVHRDVAATLVWLPPLDNTAESRAAMRALLPGLNQFIREVAQQTEVTTKAPV
jgi:hypothetical protein